MKHILSNGDRISHSKGKKKKAPKSLWCSREYCTKNWSLRPKSSAKIYHRIDPASDISHDVWSVSCGKTQEQNYANSVAWQPTESGSDRDSAIWSMKESSKVIKTCTHYWTCSKSNSFNFLTLRPATHCTYVATHCTTEHKACSKLAKQKCRGTSKGRKLYDYGCGRSIGKWYNTYLQDELAFNTEV